MDLWLQVGCVAHDVNVVVNSLLAISESDVVNSGEPGPQAKGVNHLENPLRQLHVTHRASSCAKRGGHVQLCSKPRGARGIEPETFIRRGQLLSCPPTTGPYKGQVGRGRRMTCRMMHQGTGGPLKPSATCHTIAPQAAVRMSSTPCAPCLPPAPCSTDSMPRTH